MPGAAALVVGSLATMAFTAASAGAGAAPSSAGTRHTAQGGGTTTSPSASPGTAFDAFRSWITNDGPVTGTRVAAPAGRPATSPPLTLMNVVVTDQNGNTLTSCTGGVTGGQGSTFFYPSPTAQGCAGVSLGFRANGANPTVGTYTTSPSVSLNGPCTNLPSPLIGAFKVTQATYDGSGNVLSFAVVFEGVCPDGGAGPGNLVFGTLAYNMVNSTPNQGYYLYDVFGAPFGFGNDGYLMFLGSPPSST